MTLGVTAMPRSTATSSFVVVIGSLLIAVSPAMASADPDSAFGAALAHYQRGEYRAVIGLLRPLLYPATRLSTKPKVIQAHKMLGISYVFAKDNLAAEQSFLAILAEQPRYQLDPLVDPPAAVKLFQALKLRNVGILKKIEQAQRKEERRQRAERKQRLLELRRLRRAAGTVVQRTVIRRQYWINFVPFGAGQFQNGQRLKRFVLLGAQLAFGALSAGTILGLNIAYPGSRTETNEQRDQARALNTTALVASGLFLATAAYGVIDALVFYQPETIREQSYQRKVTLAPSIGARGASLELQLAF